MNPSLNPSQPDHREIPTRRNPETEPVFASKIPLFRQGERQGKP